MRMAQLFHQHGTTVSSTWHKLFLPMILPGHAAPPDNNRIFCIIPKKRYFCSH